MPSLTEENYLKAIYVLNKASTSKASTSSIAEKMETKASSVTDMLKRLKEKKLVFYKKYQAATLTKEGEQIAVSIIRKHRLWEYFLVENLKFGWDKVHDIAEQLEHIQSIELTNKLEEYLNFPTLDPHGDPIPDRDGNFPYRQNETLSTCKEGEELIVVGVKDHSSDFLNFLSRQSIQLGSLIKVSTINQFDNSFEIQVNDNAFSISIKVAENLYVKTKNETC